MRNFTFSLVIFCSCLLSSISLLAQNAYITNGADSSVSVINTQTNTVITTIPTPYPNPGAVVVSRDGSRAFITYFGNSNNNISVINAATNTIVNNIIFPNGGSGGDGIDISPDGSKLYYASTGTEGIADTVFVINTASGSVIAGIPFSTQGGVRGIVVSPDGSKAYVADNSDIVVINTTTNTILTTINTAGNYLYGIAITPDGSTVYATAYFSEQLYILNTSTNAVSGTVSTGTESFPLGVAVSPDGSKVYVSNVGLNNVAVINTSTNTLVATVSTGQGPFGLSFTPDGSLLYVANQSSNNVSVINTSSNSVVDTVHVGQGPIAFGKFISPAQFIPPVDSGNLNIKSFAIFGGNSDASLTDSAHFGVDLGSNIGLQGGGAVGTYTFLQTIQQVNIEGNIYASTVRMGNSNTVKGNTYVYNFANRTSNVLDVAALANFNGPGNITMAGDGLILSGTVEGEVRHADNYTYTGPEPGGGENFNTPTFPTLPSMPGTSEFSTGTLNVTSTQSITPGRYNVLALSGSQTVTFSGVGEYYFTSMGNALANNFIFDFKNNTTGAFKIFIQDTANLGNLNSTIINGGDASRIYTEVQGTGNPVSRAAFSLNTSGQTSGRWNGIIWAPNGAIVMGERLNGSITEINGSLWSGTQVKLGINIPFNYVALSPAADPNANQDIVPYYPPPANGKTPTIIGSELTSLYENPLAFRNDSIIYRVFGDKVLIEAIALQGQYAATLAFLQANGFTEQVNNGPGSLIISGKFPIANLLILNTRPDLIDYARPLFWPILNSGLVQSQGDSGMQSYLVRNGYNLSGNGVKVGVISDSYNSIPGDYAGIDILNGDLPGAANPENHLSPVDLVGEYPYGQSIDEGRAMMQIIHDVAPEAQLAFRTGFTSAGNFALGIGELVSAGCKVIVDDVTYITEPYYIDGVIAHAADQAVGNGSTYFSAAGNFGKKSFEGTFSGIPLPSTVTNIQGLAHDFGGGQPFQTLNLQPGNYTIVLQWEDNFYSGGTTASGAQTDLDAFLFDNSGTSFFGFNRNNVRIDNLGTDPIEVLPFTVLNPTTAKLMIAKATGPNVRFKYIVFRGNLTINGYNGSSTLVGQANAAGAISVGAVLYDNTPPYGVDPPTIASFSSIGGTPVNGVLRNKPEIAGPNGVNTTISFNNIDYDGDGVFPNFFGTSAAAPHAAAVAALLIQGQQKYLTHTSTPAEIKSLLTSTALDMGTPGYDPITGYGFIQPLAAMQTFASPKPEILSLQTSPVVTSPVSTAFTLTVNGNNLNNQTTVYFRDAPLVTTFVNAGKVTANITQAFTDDPLVRLFNPPITNAGDGGFSDGVTLFSPVKKHVVVRADNKTKKYGEKLPAFTAKVTVNGVVITNATTPNLTDLKLNNLTYITTATTSSNVAVYLIRANNPLDSALAADAELLKHYTYQFDNGFLTVEKLPLKITPRHKTFTYGQKIKDIQFNYVLGPSATLQNADSFKNAVRLIHAAAIVDSIYALTNGSGATSRALVNTDVDGLSILISNGSGATSRALVNNGSGTLETSHVVDVSTKSIFNYLDDPATSPLVNGSGATSRALVNTGPLINGTATVIIGNGSGARSRALVNGDAGLLNSSNTGASEQSDIAVIVSEADLDSPGIKTKSANMITGITHGTHIIIPAAFLSANFDINYGLGTLRINKFPLSITANTLYSNNGQLPAFTSTILRYQYQDATTMTITGPIYKLYSSPAGPQPITFTGAPGVYTIRPSGLKLSGDSNYTKTYNDGLLYINPYGPHTKKVSLKLKCIEQLKTPKNGFRYIAHFSYQNKNATPVYIPIGPDNKITGCNSYSGVQPVVFQPGTNYVDYYFNGEKLTWSIRSKEGVSKKTVSESHANKNSPKCKAVATQAGIINNNASLLKDEKADGEMRLYPNPAANRLVVTNFDVKKEKGLMVFDAQGRSYVVKVTGRSGQLLELDISTLQKGVYFIKIKNDRGKPLSFIKL